MDEKLRANSSADEAAVGDLYQELLAVVGRGYKMRRRCRASVAEMIATRPRSEAAMIDFRELRKAEVQLRRTRVPGTLR
jgi:hypothetical protein